MTNPLNWVSFFMTPLGVDPGLSKGQTFTIFYQLSTLRRLRFESANMVFFTTFMNHFYHFMTYSKSLCHFEKGWCVTFTNHLYCILKVQRWCYLPLTFMKQYLDTIMSITKLQQSVFFTVFHDPPLKPVSYWKGLVPNHYNFVVFLSSRGRQFGDLTVWSTPPPPSLYCIIWVQTRYVNHSYESSSPKRMNVIKRYVIFVLHDPPPKPVPFWKGVEANPHICDQCGSPTPREENFGQ